MKKLHIILLCAMALAVGVLISMTGEFSEYSNFATAQQTPDKSHQIVGHLSLDKPVHYDPMQDANSFSFFMKDGAGKEMKVICQKAKPQDFERSEQIVLTGQARGEVFVASQIQLKCPSKYQDEANKTLSEK
jgi:cytochrome c-type biogenesis protein CcmE